MNELFNTPFETALRILLLLETKSRTDFTINMIAAIDFAALYGKSFEFSDQNLHGDNLFKFSEFATRKELAGHGIKYLVQKGMVDVSSTKTGFVYSISDRGKELSTQLDTKYASDYREQVELALQHFSNDSEQLILNKLNKMAVSSLEKEVATFHEE